MSYFSANYQYVITMFECDPDTFNYSYVLVVPNEDLYFLLYMLLKSPLLNFWG
jgi:hypothetical protein